MEGNDVMHVVLDQCTKPFFRGGREGTVGEERNGEGFVGFWWSEIAKAERRVEKVKDT